MTKSAIFSKGESGYKSIKSAPSDIKKWKQQIHMKKEKLKFVQMLEGSPQAGERQRKVIRIWYFQCTNEPKVMWKQLKHKMKIVQTLKRSRKPEKAKEKWQEVDSFIAQTNQKTLKQLKHKTENCTNIRKKHTSWRKPKKSWY